MSALTLEIAEGPDAGRVIALAGALEIGRYPAATRGWRTPSFPAITPGSAPNRTAP